MLTEPLVVANGWLSRTVPRLPAVPMAYEYAGLPVPVLFCHRFAKSTVPPVAACSVTSRSIRMLAGINVDVPDVLAPPRIATCVEPEPDAAT